MQILLIPSGKKDATVIPIFPTAPFEISRNCKKSLSEVNVGGFFVISVFISRLLVIGLSFSHKVLFNRWLYLRIDR